MRIFIDVERDVENKNVQILCTNIIPVGVRTWMNKLK